MKEKTELTDYSAVRNGGAGLLDLSARGRILVSGSEAIMFLNGLITNDMKTLAINSWMPAAFANVQGRLLAVVRILHRADGFLIDTEAATRETVLKLLERFTLAGDFRVTDLTSDTASLSIQGKDAARIVREVAGDEAAELGRMMVAQTNLANAGEASIIRATHTAEAGFDIFVKRESREQLSQALQDAEAEEVSAEVAEMLRIEAGIPNYGIDMDETTIVTEANLDDAVSFTKGCYLGQEIIIRIKHRGHVAKKLAGVALDEPAQLESGAKIVSSDEKEVGRVTSSIFSPQLNRTIALGYVKYDYLAPGTRVKVLSGEGDAAGEIRELPLVRGSWYEELH